MLLSTEALDPPPPPSAAPSPEGEEDPCPLIFSVNTCDLWFVRVARRLPADYLLPTTPGEVGPDRLLATEADLLHNWPTHAQMD